MRNKIVLWGTNAQEERVLVALELLADKNKVAVHTFPEAIATDDFYQQMMEQWRNDQEVAFPEGVNTIERELTVTDALLPDDIKVERGDVIQRAQTEWHFVVLSSKLTQAYEAELHEVEDRIARLDSFDDDVWETLKGFWDKVQAQLRDRTLLREHGDELRERTNQAFESLKQLRSKMDEEFRHASKENLDKFNELLEKVESEIKENKHLSRIFNDLKGLQRDLKGLDLTREHRGKLWSRIDKAFKEVKEKRFGEKGGDSSPLERVERRFKGLLGAIEKMERSIERDESELSFQERKINRTDGQLEAQIRQAKIQMVQQRIASKREKLDEMMKTKAQLESRIEKEKEREAKRQEQREVAKARKVAKDKIAEEIRQQHEALEAEKGDEIAAAVQAVKGDEASADTKVEEATATTEDEKAEQAPPKEEKKKDSLLEAIGTTLGESFEDVIDTVKAVAEVVGHQIEEKVAEIRQELADEEE
ncbi:MAG: hypothetical protein KDC54_11800 [Lewinella sp.]|nr:hypothetical protein [Lewinella sp.]